MEQGLSNFTRCSFNLARVERMKVLVQKICCYKAQILVLVQSSKHVTNAQPPRFWANLCKLIKRLEVSSTHSNFKCH